MQRNRSERKLPIDLQTGPFPSPGGRPFQDYDVYQGGCIRLIPAAAANANLTIAHTLRGKPRSLRVLYSTVQLTWRAWQAWDYANIYVSFSAAIAGGDTVIVLIEP